MKKIYFTVTNDLTFDQRMHRICGSLAEHGYAVTMVGRKKNTSLPLTKESYSQKRLHCLFQKGKLFYLEFNIRLLFYLLFKKMDAICAVDLDTIIPCHTISRWKKIPRVYDAHELFTEMKEVVTRPQIQKIWKKIEATKVPVFKHGYTVCDSITEELNRRYQVKYQTIRNVPLLKPDTTSTKKEKFILYQGAVNEARGFEFLIPAMKEVPFPLVICGDGNFMPQLKELIAKNNLENKIILKGLMQPEELSVISQQAFIGINLVENTGMNQYLSLANKFFDYINAGLPQITMNFPEYKKINARYKIALLLDDLKTENISESINKLATDTSLYSELSNNCDLARNELNWQKEKDVLLKFYHQLFNQ